ncbi:MAG: response regulator transcription factor [Anaerolineales bacterium]|nr:MAG: response regulator transcription factor [Anaerolineales bacterium]
MDTILVVDDEPRIVELAGLYLRNDGFTVLSAHDGLSALSMIEQRRPDLVVLDIMLPKMDGWEVCRRLRQGNNNVPIIMLTARGEDVDRIVGLELGADDYMVKPFNPRELVARVKAVLRRSEGAASGTEVLKLANLEIDRHRREAHVAEQELKLRKKEFDLLVAFAERPGFVFSRDQLLDHVWNYDFAGGTRTVDVHVARLRDKLKGSGVRIETVWNVGYKLVEE